MGIVTDMEPVGVCEAWARDGLQSWPNVVPLEGKLSVLRLVVAAGVGEVDATALLPAAYAPQFADAEQVLAALAETGVRARVLTPNLRGVERAVAINDRLGGAGVDSIGFPISASEAHNLANVRRTHVKHLAEIERMVVMARDAGLRTVAAVATAFGCPIQGEVPQEVVFGIADRLVDLGVERLMLSDTTGLADPVRVAAYFTDAAIRYPGVELIAHFHDTRGTGMLNTWAAVQAGATCVDACLGGIGGEPASVEQNHAGETGNVSTEDLVVLLERAGIRTGIDIDALVGAGRLSDEVLGAFGRSQVQRTGASLAAHATKATTTAAPVLLGGPASEREERP